MDTSIICERCLDSVLNFYTFKENLRRLLQPGQEAIKHEIITEEKSESFTELLEKVEMPIEEPAKLQEYHASSLEEQSQIPQTQFNPKIETNETKIALPKKRGRKRKAEKYSYPGSTLKQKTRFNEHSEPESLSEADLNCRFKLSEENKTWLDEQITLSKLSKNRYSCSQCLKVLGSANSCRNHLICIHIKSQDPLKQWISQKLRECELIAGKNEILKCVLCSKVYNSSQALRYHLKLHAGKQVEDLKIKQKSQGIKTEEKSHYTK